MGVVSSGTASCGPCDIGTALPWLCAGSRLSTLDENRCRLCISPFSTRGGVATARPPNAGRTYYVSPRRRRDLIKSAGQGAFSGGVGRREQLVQVQRRVDRGSL